MAGTRTKRGRLNVYRRREARAEAGRGEKRVAKARKRW
jgi:hypothetical protein